MTRRLHPLPPVPEAMAAVVQAAFPKGNLYVDLRTEFGTLYEQDLFADLYADRGHPIEVAPWRLALVMVMQYIEGLTDRQAADAVRRCMDWKYALSLELTDAGFHFTLLHDFRKRLLVHDGAQRLLDTFLAVCKARGWLKARGTQRTLIPRMCLQPFAPSTGSNGSWKRCGRLLINSVQPMRPGCVSTSLWHGMSATARVLKPCASPKRPVNETPSPYRLGRRAMP
jgi:transposase